MDDKNILTGNTDCQEVTMKKSLYRYAAALTSALALAVNTVPLPADALHCEIPAGWLLWHSYSDYSAMDSTLFLRTPEGSISEISGSFVHPMNGCFGTSPDSIAFMAIDTAADEWDIYLYDAQTGTAENLTERSGYRNEDPKWSPDGQSIVFKRGHWDHSIDGFRYDLAVLDLSSREVTMLTDDIAEEAMPCYSPDGESIYYASYTDGIGSICRLELSSGVTETVYVEDSVTAYYPVCSDSEVYFTKWLSADNRCDQLMKLGNDGAERLPFNSDSCDCSDACPTGGSTMIYSSTANGSYDLYYFDGESSYRLDELSSGRNDLGAAFFPVTARSGSFIPGDVNSDGKFNVADAVSLRNWLLAEPGSSLSDWKAGDLFTDGRIDTFDLCFMRDRLINI